MKPLSVIALSSCLLWLTVALVPMDLPAKVPPQWTLLGDRPGDRMIAAYFKAETAKLRDACLADVKTLDDWKARRETLRKQLLEMLGLDPMPERTDLKATVTGRIDQQDFRVEKLHFQSRPGLYVTGDLYLPKEVKRPAPAVLYVCGHGGVKKDGVSFGNKVHYQHHGIWLARHGYVCLMIDSLQLGEIEGIHHGTYNHNMWWWNNRGYTPAGVEALNCIRAVDYLQTRKEVDPERIGVTGRSGGGAYSWWIAAIDERIKAAVPVAGITDLQNHVVDGCVEGHCDCMYIDNTYRWDYPMVAALVAPRPLLIGNSDDDSIFPLDGVQRVYHKARRIYELYGAADKIALTVTEGPHKDTPELRHAAFAWLDTHLMGVERPYEDYAEQPFQPEQLKVFSELPADQVNTKIQETFVPLAPEPKVPAPKAQWQAMRDGWMRALREKCFRGWPEKPEPLEVKEAFRVTRRGVEFSAYDFTSQGPVRLRLYLLRGAKVQKAERIELGVVDDPMWDEVLAHLRENFEPELKGLELPEAKPGPSGWLQEAADSKTAWVLFAPRGIGPTAWNPGAKKRTQIRRRFMLLGQTLDGMRVWDVCRAVEVVRSIGPLKDAPLVLDGKRQTAGLVLYASLLVPGIDRVMVEDLPPSHREGPFLLNVRRFFDTPQAVAMAAERCPVTVLEHGVIDWSYPRSVAKALTWPEGRFESGVLVPKTAKDAIDAAQQAKPPGDARK